MNLQGGTMGPAGSGVARRYPWIITIDNHYVSGGKARCSCAPGGIARAAAAEDPADRRYTPAFVWGKHRSAARASPGCGELG